MPSTAAAAKLESGKSYSTEKSPSDDPKGGSKSGPKSQDDQELAAWLGGRDSNPDNVVQSHVSYRWTTSQYDWEFRLEVLSLQQVVGATPNRLLL
jgi:hypothetical protein